MELTRREHACMVLENDDHRLVIDPGSFTPALAAMDDVVAVVITHEHADHWTPEHLATLQAAHPRARFFGPRGVADAAADFAVETVADGDIVEVVGFRLEFFGKLHAVIHKSIPVVDNVGVLVNDRFYYGGDSYTLPGREIAALAAPGGAPWLKIGEAMDYVLAVAPRHAFAVHDAPLSDIGLRMHRDRLRWATEQSGGGWVELEPGAALTI